MNLEYDIWHDLGRDLCFVGDTYHNRTLANYFGRFRQIQQVRFEEVLEKSQHWIDQHQFMCAVSDVSFKKMVVDSIESRGGMFFSVVSKNSVIGHHVHIGTNTVVNHFNVIYDDAWVGNNCTVTNFVCISHEVTVKDLCHLGPYTYLCFCTIDHGGYLGARSSIFGYPDHRITVPVYTNLLADSRLTESLATSGTYSSRRLTDKRTSLELHL